jgi:hypothetical protein
MKNHFALVAGVVLLCGCSIRSLGTREGADQIVLTDAANRAITVMKVDTDEYGRRVRPQRVLCAEPSPDIARAVQSALEASLRAKLETPSGTNAGVDAAVSHSVTESVAQLGTRLATIQLLRDELSDLCRAYANGAVSSITYTLRLSRLDKKMITLLVSEASAGALSRALITVNGSSSVGGQPADEQKLKAADDRIKVAAKSVADAGKAVSDLNLKRSKTTEAKEIEAVGGELKQAEGALRTELSGLNDRVLEKWALETRGSGLIAASTASAIAGLSSGPSQASPLDLRAIHKSYLDDDDLGTLLDACLTSMEDNPINLKDVSVNVAADIALKERAWTSAEADYNNFRRRLSSNRAVTEEEMRKLDDFERNAAMKKLELTQAQRQTDTSDRTALLGYCRNEMKNITRLIDTKISNKYWIETNRQNADLCKTALITTGVGEAVRAACLKELLRTSDETLRR